MRELENFTPVVHDETVYLLLNDGSGDAIKVDELDDLRPRLTSKVWRELNE